MRFKEPPKVMTNSHIMCLIDTWPPAVLQMVNQPTPLSTVNWYLEFLDPTVKCASSEWLAYQCNTAFADGGYAATDSKIWSNKGKIIAKSHQTVSIFG